MAWNVITVLLSAGLITLTSWLSKAQPRLAGFLIALPLSTLLALAFSYTRYEDTAQTVAFARSICFALPLTLVFFVPFLLARQLGWGFWSLYGSGLGLLAAAYGIHRAL